MSNILLACKGSMWLCALHRLNFEREENLLKNGVSNFAFRLTQFRQESRWKVRIQTGVKNNIQAGEKPNFQKRGSALKGLIFMSLGVSFLKACNI